MSDLDEIYAKIEKAIEAESEKYDSLHTGDVAALISESSRVSIPIIGQTTRHGDSVEIFGDEWQAAYERAKICAERGGLIVAYGGRGTGKTQMAFHLARNANFPNVSLPAIYKNGFTPEYRSRPAIYIKAMEIFLDCKHSFSRKDAPTVKEILQKLEDAAFLIIDEAQVRGETKFEDDMLTHLIDKRYDGERATMLITNLGRKEFAATLSPSIISRIEQIGCGIDCNWQSYRTKTNNTK
jgi:DNA replication protein DnaC